MEQCCQTISSSNHTLDRADAPEEVLSNGFCHSGWADPYWDEVMELVVKEAIAEPHDVLFGRKTYDA